jgi:prefoldin subunit 5
MPIVTHEDEILLAKIDGEIALTIKALSKKIAGIAEQEKKLSDSYNDYSKALTDYGRKMRDKHKQMDTLAREERSGIQMTEVKEYKKRIDELDDQIKMIVGYYDAMKDLAIQKRNMIAKMDEYADNIIATAKVRKEIIDIGLKIEKDKEKMIAADNLNKREDQLKDAEREFERSKKELEKKWELLGQEKAEVNQKWQNLKKCIEDFE